MPYAMRDVIKRTKCPPGVGLSEDYVHDRIVVTWPNGDVTYVTRREIDDESGRIKISR